MLIAVIEDNRALAEGIANRLRDIGHGVDLLHDGAAADAHLAGAAPDLVILDLGLPGLPGLEVLRRVRQRGEATPVLILTARGDLGDRVAGLDAGADDYLIKPFEMEELEARVRALLRRSVRAPVREQVGALSFDRDERALYAGGARLDLPRRELALFECLLLSAGRIVPKETLLDFVYGTGADVEEQVVEVYVSRLRKRLKPFGIGIRAARGLGYRMEVAPQ